MNDKTMMVTEQITAKIQTIRGQRVMLDNDLAELYGVQTRVLNQAVKRNPERFPSDFMFQLDNQEVAHLRSQNVTSSLQHGGRRSPLCVFTEHGAIMAASVLNSPQAVEVSIFVVRAFIKLREMLMNNQELAAKFSELETKVGKHDQTIRSLVAAIRQLMQPPVTPDKKQIGFKV